MVRTTMQRLGLSGRVIDIRVPVVVLEEYVPDPFLVTVLPKTLNHVDVVVVARRTLRDRVDPIVCRFLQINLRSGALVSAYKDSQLAVYRAATTLARPTPVQVLTLPATAPFC